MIEAIGATDVGVDLSKSGAPVEGLFVRVGVGDTGGYEVSRVTVGRCVADDTGAIVDTGSAVDAGSVVDHGTAVEGASVGVFENETGRAGVTGEVIVGCIVAGTGAGVPCGTVPKSATSIEVLSVGFNVVGEGVTYMTGAGVGSWSVVSIGAMVEEGGICDNEASSKGCVGSGVVDTADGVGVPGTDENIGVVDDVSVTPCGDIVSGRCGSSEGARPDVGVPNVAGIDVDRCEVEGIGTKDAGVDSPKAGASVKGACVGVDVLESLVPGVTRASVGSDIVEGTGATVDVGSVHRLGIPV